ncbi:hypothetical protein SAMD00019534_052710 [Acytostelium subglobosum LB1]|uniref:hypothetical protein n=1 Tax=Acytostelium subglobosum LB1 TaxID=1410327 RepID=UPI000644B1BD|nr:hypothetical protein SAMD00019534_052710 [Acytostelium subglobosum LB1]GAM22096.1 hypothetical protein SAMD00019534_052710 [Acytostelium subglobosum LB1]|eukprot:XP_012755196.1 hypothetical protein SAMD00019534_052710 [Acytostelium subglobosum LB1]
MDSVKDQLRSLFKLLEPTEHFTHDLDGQVMCIENGSYSFFTPSTNQWISIQSYKPDERPFEEIVDMAMSTVYARGYVYVFGPRDYTSSTYSRFSLVTRKWQLDIPMVGVAASTEVATFYDGGKLIYLLGGTSTYSFEHGTIRLNRIDSFNIETPQFSRVGVLQKPVARGFAVFNNNILYYIGG